MTTELWKCDKATRVKVLSEIDQLQTKIQDRIDTIQRDRYRIEYHKYMLGQHQQELDKLRKEYKL